MIFTETPTEFLNYIQESKNDSEKILFHAGTACGKTTLISYLPKFLTLEKHIFIALSPSEIIESQIKEQIIKFGLNPISPKDFRKIKPKDNKVVIVGTHTSINNKGSLIHLDGDSKGFIKMLDEYSKEGYIIDVAIDEARIFICDENNETFKMISQITKRFEMHFTADPDDKILYDKVFYMSDEEIRKTGRTKSKLEIHQLGHNDDIELFHDVLQKRQELEKFYGENTVTAQLFFPTGTQFKLLKKTLQEILPDYGIDENQLMDLTIEGRTENETKIKDFIKETRNNTKHGYKVLITKYAGGIGLDLPSISVLGILRKIDKDSEHQRIQITGRAKRTWNGKKPENEIQDTYYLFVKNDFEFPNYLKSQIVSQEKEIYSIGSAQDLRDFTIEESKLIQVQEECKLERLKKILDDIDVSEILKKNYTLTQKYTTDSSISLSADTLVNVQNDLIINHFDDYTWKQTKRFRDILKNKLNNTIEDGWNEFLKIMCLDEKQISIYIKTNLEFREFLEQLVELSIKKIKKFEITSEKNIFTFPQQIEKHKTSIHLEVEEDTHFTEKIVYKPQNGHIYFDSNTEKEIFQRLISYRGTEKVLHNPRTNQKGFSFFIPEKQIQHAPDLLVRIKGKLFFIEITHENKIQEKEDFIKSSGTPENYLLIIQDRKGNVLTLLKSEYVSETFNKINTWKNLKEFYANL